MPLDVRVLVSILHFYDEGLLYRLKIMVSEYFRETP